MVSFKIIYTIGSDLWWCPDYVALTWISLSHTLELSKSPWICRMCMVWCLLCVAHTAIEFFSSLAFCQSRIRIYSVNTIGLFERINAALFRICDILITYKIKWSEERRNCIDKRKTERKNTEKTTYKNWNSERNRLKVRSLRNLLLFQ